MLVRGDQGRQVRFGRCAAAAGCQRIGPALAVVQEERSMERRLWSQVVAVTSGLPADVVAV